MNNNKRKNHHHHNQKETKPTTTTNQTKTKNPKLKVSPNFPLLGSMKLRVIRDYLNSQVNIVYTHPSLSVLVAGRDINVLVSVKSGKNTLHRQG